MERLESNMALIAIFVSRFEAIQIASMLRGYGIHASIDGDAHAATEYISMALGGHRLQVFAEDYEVASEILRQCDVERRTRKLRPPRLALKLMVASAATLVAAIVIPMVSSGAASIFALGYIPYAVYGLPIEPKGPADYFLAKSDS